MNYRAEAAEWGGSEGGTQADGWGFLLFICTQASGVVGGQGKIGTWWKQ